MRRLLILTGALTAITIILSACGGATPTPTAAPATQAPQLVPVDLAGPPMKIGSFYTYVDGSILAAVPGGKFTRGYQNYFDTVPVEDVFVKDFWIYTNEVTNQQFANCVALKLCPAPDAKDDPGFMDTRFLNFPVVGVNYDQAANYCASVHGRLPTEAEWEKAARGEHANPFPWGDAAPGCTLLNFNFCQKQAAKVKSYADGVSVYGVWDMAGNVKEWAADWYMPNWYGDPLSVQDPLGPTLGKKRSVRSSSFSDSADFAFAAHRFSMNPIDHLPDLGFRCVVDDPVYFAPFCQGTTMYGAGPNGEPQNVVNPETSNCDQPSAPKLVQTCGTDFSNLLITPWPLPAGDKLNYPNTCNFDPPPDNKLKCTGQGDVSIQPPVCTFNPPSGEQGTCAPGYKSEPDPNNPDKIICKGEGPGANCPTGFEFDAAAHCCTAVTGGSNEYGQCVGFENIDGTCYNSDGGPHKPHEASTHFSPPEACGGSTGGYDCGSYPFCKAPCTADSKTFSCVPPGP